MTPPREARGADADWAAAAATAVQAETVEEAAWAVKAAHNRASRGTAQMAAPVARAELGGWLARPAEPARKEPAAVAAPPWEAASTRPAT